MSQMKLHLQISHAAKGTSANKKNSQNESGTVAPTQIESLPDIYVQVWLVQLKQKWT